MKTFSKTRIIFLGAILAASVYLQAQTEEAPIIQLINEMAEKPENHQSISTYYKTMAAEARAEAEMHKTMKSTYKHDHAQFKGMPAAQSTDAHCDRLIELSLAEAAEYEALAALHDAEAAQ